MIFVSYYYTAVFAGYDGAISGFENCVIEDARMPRSADDVDAIHELLQQDCRNRIGADQCSCVAIQIRMLN